jgi:hypothetical protein
MKKAIVGFVAVGAVAGMLPVARRTSRKMREHSGQMAAHCKQMAAQCRQMAAQVGGRGEAVGRA